MTLLGTFEDMSLIDLIEIFRMGTKSGILTVERATLRGTIVVSMGRLIDAEVVQSCNPPQQIATGDTAVIRMLHWSSGEFSFAHDLDVLRHPVTIFCDSDQLLQLSQQSVDAYESMQPPALSAAQQPAAGPLREQALPDELRLPRRRARVAPTDATSEERRSPAYVHSAGLTWLEQRAGDDAGTSMAPLRHEARDRTYAASLRQEAAAGCTQAQSSRSKLLQAVMRRVRSL